jgi:hypothetical protein
MIQRWSGSTNPSMSGSFAGAMYISHLHAGTEIANVPHPSARLASVPTAPDLASIGCEPVDAFFTNASKWGAFIHQGACTSASVTAHGTSGTLEGRFRLRKGYRILRCLRRYSDETLKSLPMM